MDGSYRLKQSQKQKRVELPEQASTAQRNVQKKQHLQGWRFITKMTFSFTFNKCKGACAKDNVFVIRGPSACHILGYCFVLFSTNIRRKCREQPFAHHRSFFSKDRAHCPHFDLLHSVSQCCAQGLLHPSGSMRTVPSLGVYLLVVEGVDKSAWESMCVSAVGGRLLYVRLRGIRTDVCRTWGRVFELCLCAPSTEPSLRAYSAGKSTLKTKTFRERAIADPRVSPQSLVSRFNGGTCFRACRSAGESMEVGVTGEPTLEDMTRDEESFSGDMPAGEPPRPWYNTGMAPGYQHFSSMGKYAAAAPCGKR